MKQSIYNTRLKLKEDIDLIFNALTQKFLLIRPDVNLSSIGVDYKLYDNLVDSGILVQDDFDEIAYVNEIDQKIIQQKDFFRLTINPTLDCNLRCWYCYESKLKGSVMSRQTTESVIKLIERLSDTHKVIYLSFFGGEPFKAFDEVVAYIMRETKKLVDIKNKKCTFSFTTNGTLISEERIAFLAQFKNVYFQITLDGGREYHNKVRISASQKETYDLILSNVRYLLKAGINITLRVNYTDKNIKSLKEISKDILSQVGSDLLAHLFVSFHQVWQNADIDLHKELDEILDHFSNLGIKASRATFNNLFNPCYADFVESAVVNYNGDVYKCTAVDFINTKREGFITENGEIFWESDCQDKRNTYSVKSSYCLYCRIRPICNGACSQKFKQYGNVNYCIFNNQEREKDRVVLEILKNRINANICQTHDSYEEK